jgi:hypothetical protein
MYMYMEGVFNKPLLLNVRDILIDWLIISILHTTLGYTSYLEAVILSTLFCIICLQALEEILPE